MENDGFRAIYFNAWEDDFCDDPLVAIIGQLSHFLKRKGIEGLDDKIKKAAKSLFIQGTMSTLHKVSGVDLNEFLKQFADKAFDAYSRQGEKKNELKAALRELSGKVKADTGRPLIFIIDELDRCRPTFAIELLERVKHIFDVPDMVFVLGINRDELCSSIRSVYGEIEADTYLRRFFDMEFLLPDIDSKAFCRLLIGQYQLEQFFNEFSEFFPAFCGSFGLSLRDIDYCVRQIVFIAKGATTNYSTFQPLLSMLIIFRLKNKSLYQEYIRGDRTGSEIMNYIDKLVPPENRNRELEKIFNKLEFDLYLVNRARFENDNKSIVALECLHENLKKGEKTPDTPYLSERTQKSDIGRIEDLHSIFERYYSPGADVSYFSKEDITCLSELIELSQSFMRA